LRVITKRAGGDTDTSQDFAYTDKEQSRRIVRKGKEFEPQSMKKAAKYVRSSMAFKPSVLHTRSIQEIPTRP